MPFRRLAEQMGLLEPQAVELLSRVFDEVWLEVGGVFLGETDWAVEKARSVIAKSLIYHWGNGHSQPAILKSLALQALGTAFPKIHF